MLVFRFMLVINALKEVFRMRGNPALRSQKTQGDIDQSPWPGEREEVAGVAHPMQLVMRT